MVSALAAPEAPLAPASAPDDEPEGAGAAVVGAGALEPDEADVLPDDAAAADDPAGVEVAAYLLPPEEQAATPATTTTASAGISNRPRNQ